MDELETVQKTNAKICSNATALVDEAEEELGKIDGWLVISLALVSLSPSAPFALFGISLSLFLLAVPKKGESARQHYLLPSLITSAMRRRRWKRQIGSSSRLDMCWRFRARTPRSSALLSADRFPETAPNARLVRSCAELQLLVFFCHCYASFQSTIYIHMYACIRTYVCMYVFMHACIHTYIHAYRHAYIHIHTCM